MVLFPNDVGETSPWVAAKSRIVAIGGAEMASHRHGWRNDRAPSPEYSCERCLRRLGNAGRERSPEVAAKCRIVAREAGEMASHRKGWRNDRAPSPEYSCKRCLRRLGNAGCDPTRRSSALSRIVAIGGAEMASHRHGWRNDRAPSPEYSCKRCLRRLGNAGRER